MAKKFGSGTLGIKNLFNEASLAQIRSTHTVHYIEIELIDQHDKNRKFDEKKLQALALSIEDNGLQTPILITPKEDDRYLLLSGHRRLAAFKLLVADGKSDFSVIPAIIKRGLDADKAEESLIDGNLFTEPLTPAELAKELARKKELLEQRRANGEKIPGKLTEIIAAELGISPQTARVLDTINRRAEPEIKELFDNGEISQREAYNASRFSDEKQRELANIKKAGTKHLFPVKEKGVVHEPLLEGKSDCTGVVHEPPLEGKNDCTGVVHEPPLDEPAQLTIEGEVAESAPTERPVRQLKNHRITAQEVSIEYDGVSYLCAFGTHVNGGWIAILNFGVSAELSAFDDPKYNAEKIQQALKISVNGWLPQNEEMLTNIAQHIAEIVTKMIGGM